MLQLKQYQQRVVSVLSSYFDALADRRTQDEKVMGSLPADVRVRLAENLDYSADAWKAIVVPGMPYTPHRNEIGDPYADVYIKVPTGGGKTLLACKAIEEAYRRFYQKRFGFLLWIVPSSQIYSQTLAALTDRDHPYRHMLDLSTGGQVLVLEKHMRFTPADIQSNLSIMLLMLPATNRQNQDYLKVFQDASGFEHFFPAENDGRGHQKLLREMHNLDVFAYGQHMRQIKTSLANVIRTQRPLIVVDEGQKAYSQLARKTLMGFNPSMVLELSATPPPQANVLVSISGTELASEDMIKMDICLTNRRVLRWSHVLRDAVARQQELEHDAQALKKNGGPYIRPIVLVQVERTGKDQRTGLHVHAQDVSEYLMAKCAIPSEQIAIKTSSQNDIEGVDLLSEECDIRYIITKSALQEGWDCSFAYILAVLGNPTSQMAMTQLVGRILRQPYAKKTSTHSLNECYVYALRSNTDELVGRIREELAKEGLGELCSRIVKAGIGKKQGQIISRMRHDFANDRKKLSLPVFMLKENGQWRAMNYANDIVGNINWSQLEHEGLQNIEFGAASAGEFVRIDLSGNVSKTHPTSKANASVDELYATQSIASIVPNSWRAFEACEELLLQCSKQASKKLAQSGKKGSSLESGPSKQAIRDMVANNWVYIVEEAKKYLGKERDRLAEELFVDFVINRKLRFARAPNRLGYEIPVEQIRDSAERVLTYADGSQLLKSLLDSEPEAGFNEFEKQVARFLDKHPKLHWWVRNTQIDGYAIQGWKRHKVYPDFIVTKVMSTQGKWCVLVIETKGVHLKNEDTAYKAALFQRCIEAMPKRNKESMDAENINGNELALMVVFEEQWESTLHSKLDM